MADSYQNIKDGVKLFLRTADKKFLILLRGDRENVWDFPGGGIEEGEEAESAIKREFEEEVRIPFSSLSVERFFPIGEYTQANGTKLVIFYAETPLSGNEVLEMVPDNIYEQSQNETKEVDTASLREIFRMRENEVVGREGKRVLWGSFKPLLKILDSKRRDESKLLREEFGEQYSAYRFLGRTKEELLDKEQTPRVKRR